MFIWKTNDENKLNKEAFILNEEKIIIQDNRKNEPLYTLYIGATFCS